MQAAHSPSPGAFRSTPSARARTASSPFRSSTTTATRSATGGSSPTWTRRRSGTSRRPHRRAFLQGRRHRHDRVGLPVIDQRKIEFQAKSYLLTTELFPGSPSRASPCWPSPRWPRRRRGSRRQNAAMTFAWPQLLWLCPARRAARLGVRPSARAPAPLRASEHPAGRGGHRPARALAARPPARPPAAQAAPGSAPAWPLGSSPSRDRSGAGSTSPSSTSRARSS